MTAVDIQIVPATHAHVATLANSLRPGDALEIEWLGFRPAEALHAVMARSAESMAATIGDEVIAMWGYAVPVLLESHASVWAFSGHAADRYQVPFARGSRQLVADLRRRFSRLSAVVALEYTASVRWLKWLGFRDGETMTYSGHQFMRVHHGV